jgi:hypothetical protein
MSKIPENEIKSRKGQKMTKTREKTGDKASKNAPKSAKEKEARVLNL